MSYTSRIEWTDATWNPVTGCTKVSAGCANCYAERMARRLQAMRKIKYRDGFEVRWHTDVLDEPLRWRKPRMIFVCSMGDLFHEEVPRGFVLDVFSAMDDFPQHTFQVLTKRPERMRELSADGLHWPPNVWAGVSVEGADHTDRIDMLRQVPAALRFVSFEPLLHDVGPLDLGNVGWVIVGGETGPHARPMMGNWVRSIRDQCVAAGVPFFFKQWGDYDFGPECALLRGRILDGREWNEMPRVCGEGGQE